MVSLDIVKSCNAELCAKPLVAVFVGGTSIIGSNTLKCLAKTHGTTGKGLRAYIVGRNAKSAEKIISECQTLCPTGQFFFQKAENLALMKDVDTACAAIIRKEFEEAKAKGKIARIDLLIMCQANFEPWTPRQETSEGLDIFMSLLFYSRARFTTKLMPLLVQSSPGPAHILSIFGPGRDATFIPTDLSLRDPENYGFMSSGSHAAYFKTFYWEYLAEKYPGKISIVHYFPGLIIGDQMIQEDFPWWFKFLFKYGQPLMRLSPSTLSLEECGERTLFTASRRFPAKGVWTDEGVGKLNSKVGVADSSNGLLGGGSYRVNWNGEPVAVGKQYKQMREDGWAEKCVEHTHKAWAEIENMGRFDG